MDGQAAGSSTWSGPVLAGNRLWLASSKGQLVSVEAHTGRSLARRTSDSLSTLGRWWPEAACMC